MTANEAAAAILADPADTAATREALYKDLHRHPELSKEDHRTSGIIADELARMGVEDIPIGVTGRVGVIRNGDGRVVAMRADFDALPMDEESGVDYASVNPGVAHSCGHDVHVTALPGEEAGAGARDMVDAGIVDKLPKPDVAFAQHVMGTIPGGAIGTRRGPVLTTASSIEITVHGAGAHGSMPNLGAAIVGRLQTIVCREVAPTDTAVVTVGSFHGGTKSNIIPDAFSSPYCYWGLGGFAEPGAPGNHSPKFAPDIHPTLDRGTEAIVVAAAAWLGES